VSLSVDARNGIAEPRRRLRMSRKRRQKRPSPPSAAKRIAISVLSVIVVIAAWYLVTDLGWVSASLLPTPMAVLKAGYDVQVHGYRGTTLLASTAVSMTRVGIGFALAVLVGVPVGLAMGRVWTILAALDPFVQFFRPLPPLGYYTLLILWFGIGDLAKIVLLFLSGVPLIIVGCAAAAGNVRIRDVEAARSLGLNQRQIFWRIVLPSALPEIITSMRLALGTTFGSLVAAEIIAASSGLGFILYNAANYLLTDVVFMGIVVIGIIAVLLDRVALMIQRILVPWQGKG